MIKSDLMKRTLLVCLSLLLLLCGCGNRPQPDVEHFQGEVVATLQKPISEVTPEPLETVLPTNQAADFTPEASQPAPTDAPGSTPTPTELNPQTTSYPVQTGTITQTPQPSATANLTQVPTANLTPAPTTTIGVPVWEGVWKIWYQNSSGGYVPAELTLQVSEGRVSGTARIDGVDFTFKGDVSIDGTQSEGEWKTGSNKGRFWWRMNSADTFVGSRENRFGFCGNRTTAVQPNPCREVPPN